jgi:hypothetical protein
VGQVYAANTSGAVLGALAGGFGFLPWLSSPGAWRLAAATLLALGLAALISAGRSQLRHAVPVAALAALTIACLLADGPSAAWRHSAIGQGRSSSAR